MRSKSRSRVQSAAFARALATAIMMSVSGTVSPCRRSAPATRPVSLQPAVSSSSHRRPRARARARPSPPPALGRATPRPRARRRRPSRCRAPSRARAPYPSGRAGRGRPGSRCRGERTGRPVDPPELGGHVHEIECPGKVLQSSDRVVSHVRANRPLDRLRLRGAGHEGEKRLYQPVVEVERRPHSTSSMASSRA